MVGPQPEGPDQGLIDPNKERQLGEAIRRARGSAVSIEYVTEGEIPIRRVASGVVINDQGDLLSIRIDPPAAAKGGTAIIATDANGHRHRVRWVAADPDTGLTLLQLPPRALPPVRLAANDAALGAEVFLVGNPYGLGHSISRGHVGGLGRRWNMIGQAVTLTGLIQVQASIHPGDSGALLANLDGGWLGLVRGTLAPPRPGTGRGDDLAFVIPARDALWVADQLRAFGRVNRAFLGLRFAADAALTGLILPPDGAPVPAIESAPISGARVAEVVPGSPAAEARLQAGDRVVRMNDRPIAHADDLTDRLDWTAAGAQIALEYIRGTATDRITLRAVARPASPAPGPTRHSLLDKGQPDTQSTLVSPASTLAPAAAAPSLTPVPPAVAPIDPATANLIRSLQAQVNRLEQRIGELERERAAPSQPVANTDDAPR